MKKHKGKYAEKRAARIKRHVKKRAIERYGIAMKSSDIRKIAQLILSHKSRAIAKRSCSRSIHQVEFNGTLMNVMWDKTRHHVVTVLPRREHKQENQT